jgi:hypothetical protein
MMSKVIKGDKMKLTNLKDGKAIESVVIRYKDLYFDIDLDAETKEPTGGFGWSHDPTMNPTVPIRDIWLPQAKD